MSIGGLRVARLTSLFPALSEAGWSGYSSSHLDSLWSAPTCGHFFTAAHFRVWFSVGFRTGITDGSMSDWSIRNTWPNHALQPTATALQFCPNHEIWISFALLSPPPVAVAELWTLD